MDSIGAFWEQSAWYWIILCYKGLCCNCLQIGVTGMAVYHFVHRIYVRSSCLGLLISRTVGMGSRKYTSLQECGFLECCLALLTPFFTVAFVCEYNSVYIVRKKVKEYLRYLLALFKSYSTVNAYDYHLKLETTYLLYFWIKAKCSIHDSDYKAEWVKHFATV